jgi:hypothetical protein
MMIMMMKMRIKRMMKRMTKMRIKRMMKMMIKKRVKRMMKRMMKRKNQMDNNKQHKIELLVPESCLHFQQEHNDIDNPIQYIS